MVAIKKFLSGHLSSVAKYNRAAGLFALLALIMSFAIDVGVANPAASSNPAICAADQLAIALQPVSHGAPTLYSAAIYLPIEITNGGDTCSLGGNLRITAVGVRRESGSAIDALPTSTKAKNVVLQRGHSAYTVLGYWWTSATFKSQREQWLKSCVPAQARAFELSIPLGNKVLARKIMYLLPELCTRGKANISITPFDLQLP